MVERVGIIKNMKDDEELEKLLGEIPHATSIPLHHHPSYTNGHHHHHHHHHFVNANPTVNRIMYNDVASSFGYTQNATISPAANIFPTIFSNGHSSSSDTSSSSSSSSQSHDPIPKPYITSRNPYSSLRKDFDENLIDELSRMYINHDQNQGLHCHNQIHSTSFGDFDYLGPNPQFPRINMTSDSEINPALFGFQQNCGKSVNMLSQSNFDRGVLNYCYQPAQFGMNTMMHNVPYITTSNAKVNPNVRISRRGLGPGLEGLATSEDSLIIQGDDVSRVRKKFMRPSENGQTRFSHGQQYIFAMAKDQHGCRLLQKIFDDGNPQHVQIVFDEIIGHVVELMVNPFGNYFMQKLLEVCNEEQRMQILIAITREPRELVQISLNTHGTRVVQKLIETLKTKQQVKLVISAIEPGFIALIKDLNGNHVIQRCLQCLSNEDNKFIFEAAAKFCVEIATHQHGCCVLQRCINHSTGEHREKLVSEISKNGILLAQDAFGNYAVQYILELQIPSAVSKLTSQFKGNYVHLATQKFSSHVVEKCLAVLDGQIRSTIIGELISATNFEQLLQDPHGNYVVQTALRVSEGPLHNALVNVIESHKAISRNSPYSKRIFSHKLLRR
ncbi:hypothetical protein QVD17_26749 [Tagetes erecta]|uniref:PUM-HD domain-containing protein n=1 Tax=Tagetes erecta TaxID=13708 RepID=A0AAD8NQE1_TARER|nr:hypothetical protein QVD17_26749 [Tagetes erecta]